MAGKGNKLEFGGFTVEQQVLEEIAAIAARKVDGVTSIADGFGARLARKGAGVTAAKADDRIEIDVHLVAEYGRPLKELAGEVQGAVREGIGAMVGRPAVTVNVFVDGVTFPDAGKG